VSPMFPLIMFVRFPSALLLSEEQAELPPNRVVLLPRPDRSCPYCPVHNPRISMLCPGGEFAGHWRARICYAICHSLLLPAWSRSAIELLGCNDIHHWTESRFKSIFEQPASAACANVMCASVHTKQMPRSTDQGSLQTQNGSQIVHQLSSH
jgi:hypothetical protein